MNRSLKLPLLVALALGSGHALALDLGQIQVKSALGQPLLAEIPVQKATPAELQQLSVQLASGDEFARAGVSAGRPTIPLQFNVVDDGHGHKLIRITSDAAVNDPFLDLLIEIHGGAGKSVREFTILLDPPGSGSESLASQPAAPAPARVAKAAVAAPATHPATAGEQVANGRFGPIGRGQTLSAIARQTAPAGVDVNQMLLALKQTNPEAFYRDNINALKAGAVLRIPSKAEAETMAVAAAIAEVRRENGDWRSGTVTSSPVTVADAGTRSTTSSSPTAGAASKGDHLALVPAKEGGKVAPTTGGSEKANALHQDLLRNQEALASLQQQSADLKTRLKNLSDINGKNERLLALKDNEIAELQQKLAAAHKAAGQPAEPAHASTAVAMTAATAGANVSKPVEKPASAASAPAAAATGEAAKAEAKPAETPAVASTAPAASKPAAAPAKTAPLKPAAIQPAPVSEEPWYTQLWAQVLGAIVIVLLLLWALLGRRRKAKPAAMPTKLAPSLAAHFGDTPLVDSADDIDQNQLLDQLAEHPDDVESHLELVSLYYGRRDVERFEAAAEAMHVHVSDPHQPEWQEVLRMGEDLAPAHPLFARHDGMAADETQVHHGFDIDQYAAEPVAAPAPAPASPPQLPANPVKVSEYNFNFDLTPHESHAHPTRTTEPEPVAPSQLAEDDATMVSESASSWHFGEPEVQVQPARHDIEPREFSEDPVDTKLDLARAYLDMGDPDGARAMLDEVMHEGSQMQRDVAKRLLDDLH